MIEQVTIIAAGVFALVALIELAAASFYVWRARREWRRAAQMVAQVRARLRAAEADRA